MSSCNYDHLIYDKKNTIKTNNKKNGAGNTGCPHAEDGNETLVYYPAPK